MTARRKKKPPGKGKNRASPPLAAPPEQARVIAIANQKGGVGKTTTAINLAAALGIAGKRTLLVDFDPQGNATSGCGLSTASEQSIYHAIMGECSLSSIVVNPGIRGVDICPSTQDLYGAELELATVENREDRLRELLYTLRKGYHYIVIDCPPSLGLLTINALTAADSVLIPLQCEYYAMEGLAHLSETVRRVRDAFNPGLSVEGILLTMFDKRTNLSREVAQELQHHYSGQIFQTVIPRNVRLSEAPSFGKPVLYYDVRSIGAQSYLALASEVMNHGST